MKKSVKTTILIVRHGECPGNIEGRIRGRSDFPLNENGLRQAEAVARAVKDLPLSGVYTGPLKRARDTAEIIAKAGGFALEREERFNNLTLGPWEGRPKDEVALEFPDEWRVWLKNPEKLKMAGAENLADVARRSLDGLEELTRRHCGETFLIVSHRGLIKPMIAAAIGIAQPNFWKLLVDNASISTLMHTERFGFCLTSLNDKAHLEGIPGVQEFE